MQRPPRRDSESGQMLLLTAIILAIGFIALAGMAARIEQIPDEAEAIQEDLFFAEVDLVVAGLEEAMDTLAEQSTEPLGNATFLASVDGAVAHLVHTERGRGFQVTPGSLVCKMVSGDARLEMDVSIASTVHQVTLTVSQDHVGKTCS